jgi:hypothetical protein
MTDAARNARYDAITRAAYFAFGSDATEWVSMGAGALASESQAGLEAALQMLHEENQRRHDKELNRFLNERLRIQNIWFITDLVAA